MRTCKACSQPKPETAEFYQPKKGGRLGLDGTCRVCRQAMIREWKIQNRERLAARRRELYALDNGEKWKATELARKERAPFRAKAYTLTKGVRDRSRQSGVPACEELTSVPYVEAWLKRQPNCECCGVEFDLTPGKNKEGHGPSIDKFKCDGGYTLDNVSLICWKCNNIKRNYTAQDLTTVAKWMSKWQPILEQTA